MDIISNSIKLRKCHSYVLVYNFNFRKRGKIVYIRVQNIPAKRFSNTNLAVGRFRVKKKI